MSSAAAQLARYWHTIRHLRPVQIYGRLWFRATRPRPRLAPPPPERRPVDAWVTPARRRPSQVGPASFRFLNETRALGPAGWDDPAVPLLWRYNLHYFDDLNAEDAAQRTAWHQAFIERWIAENPPASGNSGWEPYPTSLRIVNWVKWARAGNLLTPEAVHSLAVQARWLSQRLEHHLLGNHLFANAKALIFVGSYFDGPEAERWRQRGLGLLVREIPEQILPDGGHFELSTMYQALALEDMLDLVNLSRSTGFPLPATWEQRIAAMRAWLATLSHPDGEIAFFNDAAIGVAPSPAELDRYAADLGFTPLQEFATGCHDLAPSGYLRLSGDDAVALLDVARIGPDYLPGHAHADTLSFELSVRGERCVVNSGTSVYGLGSERLRQRGTGSHNSVVVDGADSSEVWGGFRVARRGRPYGLTIDRAPDGWIVACAHDGYHRLPGHPSHHRTWRFSNHSLAVADKVTGPPRSALAMFHFHPDLTPLPSGNAGFGQLQRRGVTALRWQVGRGRASLEPSTWHPEFGLAVASHRLVVELVDNASDVAFFWE